jgi:Protein of unknown function (DUF2721)
MIQKKTARPLRNPPLNCLNYQGRVNPKWAHVAFFIVNGGASVAMADIGAYDSIATTIQSAVAPVFLFAGIGGILNVIGSRLSRSVDRARVLETLHGQSSGSEYRNYASELKLLERRIRHSNWATTLCVASALAVCLVVVLLFVSQLLSLNFGDAIALIFVLAMVLLAGGLISFLTEIQIAVGGRRAHTAHIARIGLEIEAFAKSRANQI